MSHGGDIYRNNIEPDFSVSLNPMPLPPDFAQAYAKAAERANVYPDPKQERIRQILADANGVKPENVYAGSGASELLLSIVRAVAPKHALLIEPGYSGYRYALSSFGTQEISTYFLKRENGFVLDEDVLSEITPDTDLLFCADPWNPTGANIREGLLMQILEKAATCRTTVVLDRSFYLLSDKWNAGPDAAGLLQTYPNLIVLTSCTKLFGLPGIRMGYVTTSPKWIEKIAWQLPEWNLGVLAEETMAAGMRLIRETDFLEQSAKRIQSGRTYLTQELTKLGCTVYESRSNFLLFQAKADLTKPLLERGIGIRNCCDFAGLSACDHRIGVKDQADNETLIRNLREIIPAL